MSHTKRDQGAAKTNAMRELDRAGVAYELHVYDVEDETSTNLGVRVAQATGIDPDTAFKTLVCRGASGGHAVFCIPVASELDLKKAARAAGEKALSMVAVRDLRDVTGYVRGGCSPVGMKKPYPTFIDETAQLFERIAISGGRIGTQLVLDPQALADFCGATFADVTEA